VHQKLVELVVAPSLVQGCRWVLRFEKWVALVKKRKIDLKIK
jgi:hypothetical protein